MQAGSGVDAAMGFWLPTELSCIGPNESRHSAAAVAQMPAVWHGHAVAVVPQQHSSGTAQLKLMDSRGIHQSSVKTLHINPSALQSTGGRVPSHPDIQPAAGIRGSTSNTQQPPSPFSSFRASFTSLLPPPVSSSAST